MQRSEERVEYGTLADLFRRAFWRRHLEQNQRLSPTLQGDLNGLQRLLAQSRKRMALRLCRTATASCISRRLCETDADNLSLVEQ